MLRKRVLLDADGLRVVDVSCTGDGARWSPLEPVTVLGLVLVRRGTFRRVADGSAAVLDPTVGYLQRPGQEQRVAHPAGADTCTSIGLNESLADRFTGLDVVRLDGRADLAHRMLVARAGHGADRIELVDLVTDLLVAAAHDAPTGAATASARRLVDDAREALAVRLDIGLHPLADALEVSPWHLSRMFHAVTGVTLSRYRRRLRTRAALAALADGAPAGLAALAAQAGFADQAHFTRTLKAETGLAPGRIRTMLRG